jgi:hypothetical protein
VEREIRGSKEINLLQEKIVYAQAEVSEENKARGALNVTMSKEEIQAIVEQLKVAATIEMKQEEQAWREKISIADGNNETKVALKDTGPSSNKNCITTGLKK